VPGDERVVRLVRALFEDERADHLLVARMVASADDALDGLSPRAVVRAVPSAWLPYVEAAFTALERQGVLSRGSPGGTFRWGPRRDALPDVARAWAGVAAAAAARPRALEAEAE
jgi:hypothetical protein